MRLKQNQNGVEKVLKSCSTKIGLELSRSRKEAVISGSGESSFEDHLRSLEAEGPPQADAMQKAQS